MIYNLSSQVEDLKISSKLIFNLNLNLNPLKSQIINLNCFDQLFTIKLNLSLTRSYNETISSYQY